MAVGQAVAAQRGPTISARTLTAAGWALGAVCTLAIVGTPYLRFGYHSPELHLVLDSVDACVAILLAYLLVGRLRRTHRLQDLLLVLSLVLLAAAGLGLALTIHQLPQATRSTLGVWLPVTWRTAAALLIVAAAVARGRSVRREHIPLGLATPLVMILVGAAVLWTLRDSLPIAVSTTLPGAADRPRIEGHALLIAAQALAAGCFLFASLEFTTQARGRSEEVLRWLGPGCALLGFARVNYLLFPSLHSGWLYTGDLLRTAGYACLLMGATREIQRYWTTRADLAVIEDRRRLARELHDGLVQELSWIKSEARGLSRDLGASTPAPGAAKQRVQSIVDACDFAIDEARTAVDALGRDPDEPLGYALHRTAREVADRHSGHVVVDLDDAVEADPSQRHELARITREAVGNALRHGAAQCVRITLEVTSAGRRLVVQDDGDGFDVDSPSNAHGYGLTSMRERAQRLPGRCCVRSTPRQGTTVEVIW